MLGSWMEEGTDLGFWGKEGTVAGNKSWISEVHTGVLYILHVYKDIEFLTVNFLTYLKQTINEKENLYKQNFFWSSPIKKELYI